MTEPRDPSRLDPGGAADTAVPFVSRSQSAEPSRARAGADGSGLPSLRDRGTWGLLLLTFSLQAFSWSQLEGYQLADSVEYMERALALVSGEELQSGGAVRSTGFSSLLVPLFAGAKLLGLQTLLPVVHAVRLLQMALGCGLVLACTRLGGRLGGRQAAWAAGLACTLNPVFLQYSVSPVSGVAAALFFALGLDALIEAGSRRRAFAGGLFLGGAFLMAYQTLLTSGALLLVLLLRDRKGRLAQSLAAWFGMGLGLALQILLDKLSYGEWGVSLYNYVLENVGGVVLSTLYHVGLEHQAWVHDLYADYIAHMEGVIEPAANAAAEDGSLHPVSWYFEELPTLLVAPVLALGALGLLRSWFQASWRSSLLLLTLAMSVVVMSLKGSKSFRLWLPLLPLIAPLCGWGWGWISEALGARRRLPRLALGAALILITGVLGLRTLLEVNTRRYGVYWQAMDFINAAVAEERARVEGEGGTWSRLRVSSAYHWAVFGRGSADLGLAKLSEHVDDWEDLEPEEREQLLHELVTSHWLVMHDAVLPLHRELSVALNEHFEVATTFWNQDADPGLRDVKVLRNLGRDAEERRRDRWTGARPRRLWELLEDQDPAHYRRREDLERDLPVPQSFVGRGESGALERLDLLGWSYEQLPDSDFGWITYHWWTPTGFERDYTIIDRLTVPGMKSWWRNDHAPGLGFQPTSSLPAGAVLREGYVVLPGEHLFKDEFNPIGGDFRRGDLIPVTLWIKCRVPMEEAEQDAENPDAPTLAPVAAGSETALSFAEGPDLPDDVFESADGHQAMRDGLVRIGEWLLPVGERFRVPDDGEPVED